MGQTEQHEDLQRVQAVLAHLPAERLANEVPGQVRDERYADPDGWRWVWRGGGSTQAHLIPEHKSGRANPYTLCGRRLRKPRLSWNGVCKSCTYESLDLKAFSEPFPEPVKK